MINYCTLFDSFYLSRGIAMYESLLAQSNDFHLFIFAFDDLSCSILKDLNLDKVTVISLQEFETPDLIEIKPTRTKGEYCWTCTPATILHVLEKYNVESCSYVDSDLIFYSDPSVLVDELYKEKKSVLITEHRYSGYAAIYSNKRSGRFCVQFITFMKTEDSLSVLRKWRSQCIEWCYSRHEDGKFGDQKYLDVWPQEYNNIHILENEGGGVAPWNLLKYGFEKKNGTVFGLDKESKRFFPVIFYHFQYVKFLPGKETDIGWYFISRKVIELFYIPYLAKIRNIENMLMSYYPEFKPGISKRINDFKNKILKYVIGYNIIKIE